MKLRHASALVAVSILTAASTAASVSRQPEEERAAANTLEDAKRRWSDRGGWLDPDTPPGEPIPVEQNAAVVYERAFHELGRHVTDEQMMTLGDVESVDDVDAARPIVDACARAIELAVRAGGMERCQWNVPDFPEGPFDQEAPQIRDSRDLFRLLRADFMIGRADGDTERMTRAALALLRLGDHMATDQAMIGFLVAAAIEAGPLELLSDMAKCEPLPDELRVAVLEELEKHNWEARFLDSLRVEGAVGLDMFDKLEEMGASDPSMAGPNGEPMNEWLSSLRLAHLNSMIALHDYFTTPTDERPDEPPAAGGVGSVREMIDEMADTHLMSYEVAQAASARVAVALAALDVLSQFDGEDDRFPAADEYEAKRINPYTGKPVNYAWAGDGFAVWVHEPDENGRLIIWWCE